MHICIKAFRCLCAFGELKWKNCTLNATDCINTKAKKKNTSAL